MNIVVDVAVTMTTVLLYLLLLLQLLLLKELVVYLLFPLRCGLCFLVGP